MNCLTLKKKPGFTICLSLCITLSPEGGNKNKKHFFVSPKQRVYFSVSLKCLAKF